MNIKAICTDIDGTLLNADRVLSKQTLATFKQLPKGFPVILTSSRMPSAMMHLQADLGILHSPLICYNGGLVLEFPQGQDTILSDTRISPLLTSEIIQAAASTNVHISLYANDVWIASADDVWLAREINNTKVKPTAIGLPETLSSWRSATTGTHKVMCMGDAMEIDWLYQTLENRLGNALHLYRSKDTYIEIAPKAISKASGIEILLKEKYPHIHMQEVAAFGDNYNDIDMLQAVGIGVAVGNAREEVKAVANEVTSAGKEDGVALFIKNFILSQQI